MKKNKSVLDRYADEIRSGKYPKTHPDTKQNWPGDAYEKQPKPAVDKKEPWLTDDKKVIISMIFSVVLFLASAAMLYKVFILDKPEAPVVVEESLTDEFLADIGTPEIGEITVNTEPKAYVEAQNEALEQIRAWERLTRIVIDKFFSEPIPSGYKRTLCIRLSSQKAKCMTVNANDQSAKPLP